MLLGQLLSLRTPQRYRIEGGIIFSSVCLWVFGCVCLLVLSARSLLNRLRHQDHIFIVRRSNEFGNVRFAIRCSARFNISDVLVYTIERDGEKH